MASGERVPPLERYRHVITIFLVVAIVGGSAVFVLRRPEPTIITIIPPEPTTTPPPTATPQPSATPGPIQVYVTGAVGNPDTLVTIPFGSRSAEAIQAAGGFSADADRQRVNLAQILRDGDQVHVFAAVAAADAGDGGAETADEQPALATPSDHGIVYVNQATAAELEQLPRIGPAMAQRIIDYREANGPFLTMQDMENVSGIGPATIEQLADLVSFDIR